MSDFKAQIKALLFQSEETKRKAREDEGLVSAVSRSVKVVVNSLRSGGKVLLLGNGGSAADCQHLAGEMVGRFKLERHALPAIALTVDTSVITSIANDYGFEFAFERQVEALARPGDVVMGFSTSGGSPNVLRALRRAKKLGAYTIGFTGANGGTMPQHCDICILAPSEQTPRIQEIHLTLVHIICELVEKSLAGTDEL